MAHFAEIDKKGIVLRVVVTSNDLPDEGKKWLKNNLGGTWVQTSYNTIAGVHTQGGTPLRKNYAGIGFTYDKTRDAFIPPKTYPSWILDEETCLWEPPISKPETGEFIWDEEIQNWVELEDE